MPTPNTPADPGDEFRQIIAQFRQAEQARMDDAKKRLRTQVLPRLVQQRVANIEAAYSGFGDSGAIDGLQFRDAAGQRVDRTTLPLEVIEQLENCIYEFLPAGFEINDGGQGSVLIETLTAKVTIQHQNYTEPRDSTREFTL
ncbi:MAG: hypothetical protein K8S94_09165 [Planctomycetia bacterium]|nr:hypothetical protein [Planctomycetia bacterium]